MKAGNGKFYRFIDESSLTSYWWLKNCCKSADVDSSLIHLAIVTQFCWSRGFFLRSSKHDGEWIYRTLSRRNVDLNFRSGGVAEMRAHKSNIYERMKFYANIIRDWNFWDLRELKRNAEAFGSLQKTHSVIKIHNFMLQRLLSYTVCFRSNVHKASLCVKYLRWN